MDRTTLQSAVDTVNTSSRAVAMAIVLHGESWLHFCFCSVVRKTIEDLPFDGAHLFNQKTDKSFMLKVSKATFHSLGINTPVPK